MFNDTRTDEHEEILIASPQRCERLYKRDMRLEKSLSQSETV